MGLYICKMGKSGFERPKGGWVNHANREYRQVKQEGGCAGRKGQKDAAGRRGREKHSRNGAFSKQGRGRIAECKRRCRLMYHGMIGLPGIVDYV